MTKAVERYCPAERWTQELNIAIAETARNEIADSLRSLPTDDGWEDIATHKGPENEYIQVWCQCEDSGLRWTTAAYRLGDGQWFNDLEGYIPVKGYRPLPAPPAC